MTDKGKLTNLLIQENNAAQKAGFSYLRNGKQTIEKITAEISDETAKIMVDVLTSRKPNEDGVREDREWLQSILWEIYFTDRGDGDGNISWPIMQEALNDLYQQEQRFYSVSQSKITNAMAHLFENGLQMDIEGNASASVGTRQDKRVDFKLVRADKHTIRPSAKKLKDALLKNFSETHSNVAIIPFKEYAKLIGKDPGNRNSMKALRKQVVEDLELLGDLKAQYYERINGKWTKSGFIRLCGSALIENGIIRFNWDQDIIPSLEKMAPIDYSAETFLADTRTAAYDFSFYIDVNYRRNESKDSVNTIKIATLLSITDKIPDIDEIKKQRASTKTRVIRPFITALDSLNRIYYDVYTKDGQRVDDPLEMDIEDFRNGYIIIDYSDYPQHPERIKKREQRKKRHSAT